MNRENLQARLQDIPKLSLERRIDEYEKLFDKFDVDAVEKFSQRKTEEEIVMEVKRRIWLTYKLTKDLGLEKLNQRTKTLLKENFNNG